MTALLLRGDCVAVMAALRDGSVDAVVTDPPYGLGFMGKEWDTPGSFVQRKPAGENTWDHVGGNHNPIDSRDAQRTRLSEGRKLQTWGERWALEALRAAKPGAHLVAFGGTRTFHRLTCAIEDAGWEIRDCLSWLYGSGFPKSHNLDGEHRGWGTALKPGWEPIVLARKPLDGTVAANVAAHGTGALNVDGCRIGGAWENPSTGQGAGREGANADGPAYGNGLGGVVAEAHPLGRWPANVVLSEEAAAMLDAQSGELASGLVRAGTQRSQGGGYRGGFSGQSMAHDTFGDSGGASRFFYCAKASRAEREAGLDALPPKLWGFSGGAAAAAARGEEYDNGDGGINKTRRSRNHHPTVKPVALMRWLCRLVTPPGGLVLDPFTGSGSTGVAAVLEGFRFLGIEREPEYLDIARRRIAHAAAQPSLFQEPAA